MHACIPELTKDNLSDNQLELYTVITSIKLPVNTLQCNNLQCVDEACAINNCVEKLTNFCLVAVDVNLYCIQTTGSLRAI